MADPKKIAGNPQESWVYNQWRPFMAWSYGIVCLWDFMLAPIFFAWFSHFEHLTTPIIWVPLTTSGGGLYHVAMGAIIGVTSYGRTKEKVLNNSNGLNALPQMPQQSSDSSGDSPQ